MDGKGRIDIKVHNTAQQVWIDVCDTGKGIHKHQVKKVFNPGFTTKKRGWGLGLSLARRIIERYHHGSIFVKHSEQGKGTTFRIILRR
jgi:signal transduction histidine kinase